VRPAETRNRSQQTQIKQFVPGHPQAVCPGHPPQKCVIPHGSHATSLSTARAHAPITGITGFPAFYKAHTPPRAQKKRPDNGTPNRTAHPTRAHAPKPAACPLGGTLRGRYGHAAVTPRGRHPHPHPHPTHPPNPHPTKPNPSINTPTLHPARTPQAPSTTPRHNPNPGQPFAQATAQPPPRRPRRSRTPRAHQ
jgi:hypothetical protein